MKKNTACLCLLERIYFPLGVLFLRLCYQSCASLSWYEDVRCNLSCSPEPAQGCPASRRELLSCLLTSRAGCGVKRFFPMGCSKDGVALGFIPSGPKCRAWISPLGPRGAEVRLEASPSKRIWPEEHWREEGEGGQTGCGGRNEETQLINNLHLILHDFGKCRNVTDAFIVLVTFALLWVNSKALDVEYKTITSYFFLI